MFWRRQGSGNDDRAADARLLALVRQHLAEGDDDHARIVTAVAGLLATVAFADRDFSDAEQAAVEDTLATVQGLSRAGAQAISAALLRSAVELSSTMAPRFARTLRDLADRDLRLLTLRLLVDLAAADGTISLDEVNQLRLLSQALGLTQADYNAAQAPHRDRLSGLRDDAGTGSGSEGKPS